MTVVPAVSGERLLEAWQEMLPKVIQPGDGFEIHLEEARQNSLLIHIAVSGHSMYSFDFRCQYVDDREVKVELLDAQQGKRHIDERHETVQQLIEDYVRHIRECAQKLQGVTHA